MNSYIICSSSPLFNQLLIYSWLILMSIIRKKAKEELPEHVLEGEWMKDGIRDCYLEGLFKALFVVRDRL